jgi:hypothetical protein
MMPYQCTPKLPIENAIGLISWKYGMRGMSKETEAKFIGTQLGVTRQMNPLR